MLINIGPIYCVLLITEIKAYLRFISVIEKAFYFGYHLHPGENRCGLVPRLKCSQSGYLLCASYNSIPQIPDLSLRKENLEVRWGRKEFTAESIP